MLVTYPNFPQCLKLGSIPPDDQHCYEFLSIINTHNSQRTWYRHLWVLASTEIGNKKKFKPLKQGDSGTLTADCSGSVLGQGTKIPQACDIVKTNKQAFSVIIRPAFSNALSTLVWEKNKPNSILIYSLSFNFCAHFLCLVMLDLYLGKIYMWYIQFSWRVP